MMYQTFAALFVAQAFNIEMPITTQIAMLESKPNVAVALGNEKRPNPHPTASTLRFGRFTFLPDAIN
jgi:hypothetical protein